MPVPARLCPPPVPAWHRSAAVLRLLCPVRTLCCTRAVPDPPPQPCRQPRAAPRREKPGCVCAFTAASKWLPPEGAPPASRLRDQHRHRRRQPAFHAGRYSLTPPVTEPGPAPAEASAPTATPPRTGKGLRNAQAQGTGQRRAPAPTPLRRQDGAAGSPAGLRARPAPLRYPAPARPAAPPPRLT